MKTVRKDNFLTFLSIFSLINMFFIPEWANFFGERSAEQFFLSPNPFQNAYFALGLIVVGISLSLFCLVMFFRRAQLTSLEAAVFLGMLVCLFVPLNFLREFTALFNYYPELSYKAHWLVEHVINPLQLPLIFLGIVGFYKLVRHRGEQITTGVALFGLVLSPVIVITYANLVKVYRENTAFFNPKSIARRNNNLIEKSPKVIWIVFDEMDYRLVFEQRPSNIKLPEIDRLKNEVVFLEKSYPPSDYTINSIPSLLSGERVDVSLVEPTDLVLWEPRRDVEEKWTQAPNLFKEVKKLGYSTSLIGWYHSYCKVFRKDLDYCRAFPAGRFGYGRNFWASVTGILGRAFVIDKRLERTFIYNLSRIHRTALEQIENGLYDLTFLHYSVPHKPYLYDQVKHEISPQVERSPENYFGNLIVVDQILKDVRERLEADQKWKETVIIVSADHSWRKSEEYDGTRDFRVPFMIKMADGKAISYGKPTPNVITKDLILEIMKGKINSSPELVSWLDKHNQSFPKGTVLNPYEKESPNSQPRKSVQDIEPKG